VAERHLVVTIDTEVDKSADWSVSDPPTFRSVTQALPERMVPLCEQFAVRATFLLSPEVIEDKPCQKTLLALAASHEMGTHLHGDFIGPNRLLDGHNAGGARAAAAQAEYTPELEQAKLRSLTDLYISVFGARPRAFRAGRFSISPSTLTFLAELGYRVDSSVTPGLRWQFESAVADYRNWVAEGRTVRTSAGPIVELPVSVRRGSPLAPLFRAAPRTVQAVARRATAGRSDYHWLRPSWCSGKELVQYALSSKERILVLMMHNVELVAGASPYARNDEGVDRILASLAALFAWCSDNGFRFSTMSEAAELVS
jgi:hypothetical protein